MFDRLVWAEVEKLKRLHERQVAKRNCLLVLFLGSRIEWTLIEAGYM